MAAITITWKQIANALSKQPPGKEPPITIDVHTHGGRKCTNSSHDPSCASMGPFLACTKVGNTGYFVCIHLRQTRGR